MNFNVCVVTGVHRVTAPCFFSIQSSIPAVGFKLLLNKTFVIHRVREIFSGFPQTFSKLRAISLKVQYTFMKCSLLRGSQCCIIIMSQSARHGVSSGFVIIQKNVSYFTKYF